VLGKLFSVVFYHGEALLTVLPVLRNMTGLTRMLIVVIDVILVIRNLIRVGGEPHVVRYVLLLSEVLDV
jgi:hypothetical protein